MRAQEEMDKMGTDQKRLETLYSRFETLFGRSAQMAFSSPGRSEIIGNHTDHQHGCVMASAISEDALAVSAARDDQKVKIYSEGFAPLNIQLSSLEVMEKEKGLSEALVRGVAAGLYKRGYKAGGFEAVIDSRVAAGSGLSSSAAYENLICGIFSGLYNGGSIGALEQALISREAENEHFGKPCGLEDQLASALGGINFIDFKEALNPKITPIDVSFEEFSHSLIITDTGASHALLTGEYAAVTKEMFDVAAFFKKNCLREVSEEEFYAEIKDLRGSVSDRAILRAHHFFTENKRVCEARDALCSRDFSRFLSLLNESGESSFMYLQNVYPSGQLTQSLAVALTLSKKLLGGRGSVRVHGGGFAGTIAAVVPFDLCEEYINRMTELFGEGKVKKTAIRKSGVCRVK